MKRRLLGLSLDGSDYRLCAILPQLVAAGTSNWCRWYSFGLHLHTPYGVYLPADGWCMDESPAEKQPNGRCIQYGE